MRRFSIMAIALLWSYPAVAIEVGSYRSSKPDYEIDVKASIYDLERCFIEIDGPSVPVIYRQPDRPDEVMIAWPGGDFGGVSIIRIKGMNPANVKFWGRDKIMRRANEACLSDLR